jgi:hypothetical protein
MTRRPKPAKPAAEGRKRLIRRPTKVRRDRRPDAPHETYGTLERRRRNSRTRRAPSPKPVIEKLADGRRLKRYKPIVEVTHRTPKQVKTNERHRDWRARQKKKENKRNPIHFISSPWTREELWLMGFSDSDLKNKKLVGQKIAELHREAWDKAWAKAWAKSEKFFGNAFRCPHCHTPILY